MELRQIETFYWIATLGSFSAAAERLNATQPGISNRISALEQELGVTLFDRSLRQVRLTPEGKRVLEYAARMVQIAAELRKAAAGKRPCGGKVRLGAVSTITHTWLPRLIKQIYELFPDIEVVFSVETTTRLQDRLRKNEMDITISSGQVIQPGIINKSICKYDLEWVASSSMQFNSSPVLLAEIAKHTVIIYPVNTVPHDLISSLFQRQGVRPLKLLSADSVPTMVELAANSVGVCAIPSILVERHLAPGQLQVLCVEAPLPALEFFVSYWEDLNNDMLSRIADVIARESMATSTVQTS